VWVPAIIQKVTGGDPLIIFRIFPAIIYSLMPMFTYLIMKRYLSTKYSLLAVSVLLINSHFIYFPDIGRVGISLGVFAGLLWALLSKRLIWAIIFSILVVFSHYGLSVISIGLIGAIVFFSLVIKHKLLRQYLIVLSILIIFAGVWHFGVARYSGFAMLNTGLQTDVAQSGFWPTEFLLVEFEDLYTVESRSVEVQKAFGATWSEESSPARIEIIANWLVVFLITVGLYVVWRSRSIDFQFKVMVISLYGLVCFTVFVPWLSIFYGVTRALFTSSIVLVVCVPLGSDWLAKKLHVPALLIVVPILALYAASTTGIIYLPFGLEKLFPVLVRME